MTTDAIEKEIKDKGLVAPRVTPADVEAEILHEACFTAEQGWAMRMRDEDAQAGSHPSLGLLTLCVLTLRNGFTVTGESACASPENFDAELGRKIARQNAVGKIWPLLGFRLRDQLLANASST